jgi:hypothetical protein
MAGIDEVGLGLAPHSGWAVAVGVSDENGRARVVVRERVELVQPGAPESKQPYHAVERLPVDEAVERLAAWAAVAEQRATAAVREICDRLSRTGRRVSGLGILDSAGRRGKSLADTLASHALIHTADGEHFRAALAAAAARCGLPVLRVPARELVGRGAAATRLTAPALADLLKGLGRGLGPPWGADQKAAALLAWLVLSDLARGGRTASPGPHRA